MINLIDRLIASEFTNIGLTAFGRTKDADIKKGGYQIVLSIAKAEKATQDVDVENNFVSASGK